MRSDWLLEDHSKVGLGWAYFMVSIYFLSKLKLCWIYTRSPNLSSSTVGFTPEDIIWAYRLLPGRIILLFGPMLVFIWIEEEFMGVIVYRSFGITVSNGTPGVD